ncbi:Catsper1 [Symbiodinium necroappetens]|uniref:Catsper1 protein n=1 Tax=Symbiodinium necroappetens TaxID=1628268 RepID=A0A812ZG72_9DINO|nr:Catsper1 [Symbiodinium necroappetens]
MQSSYFVPFGVDVSRFLEGDAYIKLRWMTSEKKKAVQSILSGDSINQGLPGTLAPPAAGDPNAALPGAAGSSGLAAALASQKGKGTGYPQVHEAQADERELGGAADNLRQQGKNKRTVEDARTSEVDAPESYQDISSGRKPRESRESALRLSSKRKRKKSRKERKRSSSAGSTTSADDEPVFRLVSLPEGVDKKREMHERKPGHLANLTLLRYQELLERSTGREARTGAWPPNDPEMQTILTAIDYLASNDVLRALDVLIQHRKALELATEQGSWSQANLLELVNPSEERSYFRQELKAVQSEHIAELQLQRNPWEKKGRGAGKGDTDPEAAPFNMGDEEQKGNKKRNKGGKGGKHRGNIRIQEMLTTVSKHMHSAQYNRPLARIFNKVFHHIALERCPPLDTNVADELWLLLMALPAHWMNTKAKLDHRAWATDASEDGGGACHSVQISKVGEARAHLLAHDVECIGGSPAAPILVVEVYGGWPKPCFAVLGRRPHEVIFLDSNARARKLEKSHMLFALFYSKIEELTQEGVSRWRNMFRRV